MQRKGVRTPKPLAVLVAVSLSVALGSCGTRGEPLPAESTVVTTAGSGATTSATTTSPDPSLAPTVSVQHPCESGTPSAPTPSATDIARYRDVIQTANTEPVSSTACDPLTLILSATECCEPRPKDEALADWGRRIYDPAMGWSFNVDPGLLGEWRLHAYGQFVPEGALIAVNPDGRVTSMLFDGNLVTLLFVGSQEMMMW